MHTEILLGLIALLAATVNGALGYGFSSITVPLALLFVSNKVLSPALVIVEVVINLVVLAVNREALPKVWRRMLPFLYGLVPGAIAGTLILAGSSHGNLKLATYAVLLPLILLQAAGVRRPVKNERVLAIPVGAGVGALYAATTISGPPLALLLNNQGFTKSEFRAALGLFRVGESVLTAALYLSLGLFTRETLHLSVAVVPSIVLGVPLGYLLLRRISGETFRRACMGADALLVGFGLWRALAEHGFIVPLASWIGFAATATLVALLIFRSANTRSLVTP